MKKLLLTLFALIAILTSSACSQGSEVSPDGFILIKGGSFVNESSNLYGQDVIISDFYIGRFEVTQKEWLEVMDSNPSIFPGDDRPVENVTWYECIEYCNKRSEKEGLEPYYHIDKETIDENNLDEDDDRKWIVTINEGANGYRLPLEVEWEYAASGGRESKSYLYSGSNDVDEVAWHFSNSGDEYLDSFWVRDAIESNNLQTHPVGRKKSNELGLYDMSGNVREWCWDWYGDATNSLNGDERVWRGGGWMGDSDFCRINFRGSMQPSYSDRYPAPDQGFRLCRG
ncbi:MAG: formylglycine-generating enzyme family protein [Lachnospiraceae bacterium]|nr:formylglycine-generating enzyme family protein [Lachnospiraceae bacterium]